MDFKKILIFGLSASFISCHETSSSLVHESGFVPDRDEIPTPLVQPVPACSTCSADTLHVVNGLAKVIGANCNFGVSSVTRGYRCQVPIAGYPQPVDYFVSPLLDLSKPLVIAYHFHGWWTIPSQGPFDGPDGDYASFVASSKANMVLIVPESTGDDTTYSQQFTTGAAMTSFFSAAEGVLSGQGAKISMATDRIVSAHSGAYLLMGNIGLWLGKGQLPHFLSLRGTALLDTAYSNLPGFTAFMDKMCLWPHGVYLLAYNPSNSSGKNLAYQQLDHTLSTQHACASVQLIDSPDNNTVHDGFPGKYLPTFYAAVATDLPN